MSILTCPTRFKRIAAACLASALLAACATGPVTEPGPAPRTAAPEQAVPASPSVLVRGKTGKIILDSVVRYRTQKGMKVISRDSSRVVLGIMVPKSNPPAEARMIYSLAPASEGLRLTVQVFQITRSGGKIQNAEITESLRDNIEEELEMYAR